VVVNTQSVVSTTHGFKAGEGLTGTWRTEVPLNVGLDCWKTVRTELINSVDTMAITCIQMRVIHGKDGLARTLFKSFLKLVSFVFTTNGGDLGTVLLTRNLGRLTYFNSRIQVFQTVRATTGTSTAGWLNFSALGE